jgi:hypothetical protein
MPNFWSDRRAAQEVIDQITIREKPLKALMDLQTSLEDVSVLQDLAEEEDDESVFREVSTAGDLNTRIWTCSRVRKLE